VLFGHTVERGDTIPPDAIVTTQELVATASNDIVQLNLFGGAKDFDLERVIDGAASLEFLVRYARLVGPSIFPNNIVPSDEVVNACLTIFHTRKQSSALASH